MVRAERSGEEVVWARLSVRRELGHSGITGHDEGPGVCDACNEETRVGSLHNQIRTPPCVLG